MTLIAAHAVRAADGRVLIVPAPATHARIVDVLCAHGYTDHGDETIGFITSDQQFLTNAEAGALALKSGQAKRLSRPPYLSWDDLQ